uniref:JmjC domain-containing protein n=1 Tax=Ciona savignyi TaxID=51511 RepID=H2YI05_CIOSA
MKLVQSDASFHIKFPKLPPPPTTNVTHPRGQYEELGMQRPPIGQVPEYFETPTPRELWDKHVKMYRPGVLRGALNGSPALHKWTDEYLASEYGDQEVLVEKKYEDRKTEPKRMGIEGFLQQYTQHNWYVVTILPNVMRKDLKVPKPLMCSTFRENMQELNLWIGTHGTRSMLHFDADNIIHCLVSGRKDWILINPDNKPLVDMVMGEPGQGSGFSHLNVDAVDLFSTPEIANVPWEYATLYAGDCLYLPPQYLHQVRSYNRSISATYLFYPRDTFDDSDCANVDFDSYLSLKDIYVYWVYEKGQETVDMGYGNPVNVRGGFEDLIKHMNMTNIDFKEYLYLMAATNSDEAIVENPLQ